MENNDEHNDYNQWFINIIIQCIRHDIIKKWHIISIIMDNNG